MLNYIVLTALGENHPQIIEKCSKAIKECGCNIIDSRVIALGKELSLSMMLSGSWSAVAKLEHMLPSLKKKLNVEFQFRRTSPPDKPAQGLPYAIEIVSMDRIGVVHPPYFLLGPFFTGCITVALNEQALLFAR